MLRSPVTLSLVVLALLACDARQDGRTLEGASRFVPSESAVRRQIQARDVLADLAAVEKAAKRGNLPALCKASQAGPGARALVATRGLLRRLRSPADELSDLDRDLSSAALTGLATGLDSANLGRHLDVIRQHRHLVVVEVERHRAPRRRGDRTITMGKMRGNITVVDTKTATAICRASIRASSNESVNAYGELSEEAFARDLSHEFLREVNLRLAQSASGLELADVSGLSRLASREASSPSPDPP
jgi:hypothetical protein